MKITRKTLNNASEAFEQEKRIAAELIKRLQAKIAQGQEGFAKDSKNFGRVGSLSQMNCQLATALASIGDTSAVQELGISW